MRRRYAEALREREHGVGRDTLAGVEEAAVDVYRLGGFALLGSGDGGCRDRLVRDQKASSMKVSQIRGHAPSSMRATGDPADGGRRRTVEENDAHNRSRSDDCGSGASPGTPPVAAAAGPLAPGQRWSAARKREVALRLLRGESVEALSRELGVEVYRLEEWKSRALAGTDASLRERETASERLELDSPLRRLGELMMDHEVLLERCRRSGVSPEVRQMSAATSPTSDRRYLLDVLGLSCRACLDRREVAAEVGALTVPLPSRYPREGR